MSDSIAAPEPMEESRGSDKIDLSLDDIIKRNKKGPKAPPGGYRRRSGQQAASARGPKTLDRAGPRQSFRAQRGAYRFQQGPNRFRYMGPPARDFYRFRPYYPRRGTATMRGVSPLNRPLWNAKNAGHFGAPKTQLRGSYYQPYRGPRGAPRRLRLGQSNPRFQPRQRQQRTAPIILNRGFLALRASGKLERYQKARRWRRGPSPGSILTVSLENSKVTPEPRARITQPAVSDGSLEDVDLTTPQPKGVPLRFNFKAVSNQTGVTLNDRFTSLKIRGGPGQRPWRGRGRGGRGRGGRMVTLQ